MLHIADDVRRHQNNPVVCEFGESRAQTHALFRVEARSRLVHNEKLRVAQKRCSGQKPLLHAAGVRREALVELRFQMHERGRALHFLRRVRAGQLFQRREVEQKAAAGKAVVEALLLRHVAEHAAEARAETHDIFAVPQYLAARSIKVASDDVHHRAFARTVRPEQAVQTRPEREADAVECFFRFFSRTIDFRQPAQFHY